MASKPDKQITRTTAIGAAQRMLCIKRSGLEKKAPGSGGRNIVI